MSVIAIPSPVKEVLELFSTDLGEVRFGDIDGRSLASLASNVEAAAVEVAALELQLIAARTKLQEQQDALLQQAQRALAYARVFAESDPVLAPKLEAIALPRAPRRARTEPTTSPDEPQIERRPRGRPRKSPAPTQVDIAANAE
jgi:hypothetical protein